MKREAVNHSKMKRLCRRMNIPLWQAIGLLESIWHLTAKEKPRGDLGRLSDEDIALAIDYRGEEAVVIEALVYAGWLDRDPIHRLVVHDWFDHADDAVHLKLARSLQFFVGGQVPRLSRLGLKERERAHNHYSLCAQTDDMSSGIAQTGDLCAQTDPVGALPEPRQSPAPPEPEPEPRQSQSLEEAAVGTLRGVASKPGFSPPPIEDLHRESPPLGATALRQQIGFLAVAKSLEQPRTPNRGAPNHRDADYAWFRDELRRYPGSQRLPQTVLENGPDDAIVTACMKLCDGDRERFAAALLGMHRASKTPQLSWAWFPPVLAQYMPAGGKR